MKKGWPTDHDVTWNLPAAKEPGDAIDKLSSRTTNGPTSDINVTD